MNRVKVDCHTMMMNPHDAWVSGWQCSKQSRQVVERISLYEYVDQIHSGLLTRPLPPFFIGIPPVMTQVFLMPKITGLTKKQKDKKANYLALKNKNLRQYKYFYMDLKEQVMGKKMEWLIFFHATEMYDHWAALYRLHGDLLSSNFSVFTLYDSLARHLGSLESNCVILYRDQCSFVCLQFKGKQLYRQFNLNPVEGDNASLQEKWRGILSHEPGFMQNTLYLVEEPNCFFSFTLSSLVWDGPTVVIKQVDSYEPLTFQQLGLVSPRKQWTV